MVADHIWNLRELLARNFPQSERNPAQSSAGCEARV
jgi:hypothetical protein